MRAARLAPLLAAVALPAVASALPVDLEKQVQQIDLANGMKFLFVQRPGSGVFSAYLRVKVGGADERIGETGVAHLFEHMAFKGTSVIGTTDWPAERAVLTRVHAVGEELAAEQAKRDRADPEKVAALKAKLKEATEEERRFVKKDEFTDILLRNGAANLNATTDKDMTSYYMSLPKNRLHLWALMEAQRFAGPVLREFYSERDVVMEERRMRTDTSPVGLLFEAVNATAFDNSPYRWPTIGWMEDLQTLSIDDSMELRRRAYVPANLVGAIVGDLDPTALRGALERTFGEVPSGPAPHPIKAVEPGQQGEKRRVVRFAASPQLIMAFHKPTLPHPDDYVFDVIDQLLSGGRTSRLYRRLVLERKLASDVYTFGGPGSRLDNLFYVGAEPLPGVSVADLEREVEKVLAELASDPPPEAELSRVRRQIETDQLRGLATNEGLASALSYFETVAGDWRYLARHGEAIEKVSAQDVARAARAYLVPQNRTVVTLEPLPQGEVKP